ncbi:hypothetical protein BKA93DRAFT_733840, partial [Sparassis latifolia]
QKAWKIMTKIVNSLTAKSEIGPMHFRGTLKWTNGMFIFTAAFKVCYWRSYVKEVEKAWQTSEPEGNEQRVPDKVILGQSNGKYIGISPVVDYMHRPPELESISLYDWIQHADKKKMSKQYKYDGKAPEDCETLDNDSDKGSYTWYQFSKDHPQYETHYVRLVAEQYAQVPNFVGGGNREDYCMTMLTLFKPWQTGLELKVNSDVTWDDSFNQYEFTERQHELLKFFNLRYECNYA